MNVSFTSRNPVNTTVVDNTTERAIFVVSTTAWGKPADSTTTMLNCCERFVAAYERRLLGHDDVTLRGTILRLWKRTTRHRASDYPCA